MPIKDQCANFRYQEGKNCQRIVPSFDGTSCEVYAKRINLEKENEEHIVLPHAETGAEVTVVSDYDTDITKKNFNQYWRGWKSEELDSITTI